MSTRTLSAWSPLARGAGWVALFLAAALVLGLIRLALMAGAEATRASAPAPAAASEWDRAVAAFVAGRCELNASSPATRHHVDVNLAILQQAIADVDAPDMTPDQVLAAAGERVYAYPRYTPRGYCPSP